MLASVRQRGNLEMGTVRKPLQQPSEMEMRGTQLKPQEETGKNDNKQKVQVFKVRCEQWYSESGDPLRV